MAGPCPQLGKRPEVPVSTLKGHSYARPLPHFPRTAYLEPEIPSYLHNTPDKGDKEAYCITSGAGIASAPTGPNLNQSPAAQGAAGRRRGASSLPAHPRSKATHRAQLPLRESRERALFRQCTHGRCQVNHGVRHDTQLCPPTTLPSWLSPRNAIHRSPASTMAWTRLMDIKFVSVEVLER